MASGLAARPSKLKPGWILAPFTDQLPRCIFDEPKKKQKLQTNLPLKTHHLCIQSHKWNVFLVKQNMIIDFFFRHTFKKNRFCKTFCQIETSLGWCKPTYMVATMLLDAQQCFQPVCLGFQLIQVCAWVFNWFMENLGSNWFGPYHSCFIVSTQSVHFLPNLLPFVTEYLWSM